MTDTYLATFALSLLFLGCMDGFAQSDSTREESRSRVTTSSNQVDDSIRVVAHFMCIWPEPDSLLEWTILRELIPPDCEHFMDESTTDMGQEECTDKIAYRNGNFMHFPATKAGVYMFFGVMPGSSDIRYSGVVRLGEDILDDWPGAKTDNGIPLANMMWLDTRALWYPFCN